MLASADDIVLLYVTCPSEAVAEQLASPLVEAGLVACANLLPELKSIYAWQGALKTDSECLLLLKTRRERSEEVVALIRLRHPYQTPCILVLGVEAGLPDYLDWLRTTVVAPDFRSR